MSGRARHSDLLTLTVGDSTASLQPTRRAYVAWVCCPYAIPRTEICNRTVYSPGSGCAKSGVNVTARRNKFDNDLLLSSICAKSADCEVDRTLQLGWWYSH